MTPQWVTPVPSGSVQYGDVRVDLIVDPSNLTARVSDTTFDQSKVVLKPKTRLPNPVLAHKRYAQLYVSHAGVLYIVYVSVETRIAIYALRESDAWYTPVNSSDCLLNDNIEVRSNGKSDYINPTTFLRFATPICTHDRQDATYVWAFTFRSNGYDYYPAMLTMTPAGRFLETTLNTDRLRNISIVKHRDNIHWFPMVFRDEDSCGHVSSYAVGVSVDVSDPHSANLRKRDITDVIKQNGLEHTVLTHRVSHRRMPPDTLLLAEQIGYTYHIIHLLPDGVSYKKYNLCPELIELGVLDNVIIRLDTLTSVFGLGDLSLHTLCDSAASSRRDPLDKVIVKKREDGILICSPVDNTAHFMITFRRDIPELLTCIGVLPRDILNLIKPYIAYTIVPIDRMVT